ncbi:MAG: hypothetical protein PF694_01395 [Bacteroidetes bacterium]|jgi:hypothetical protein|nr:hypothetical protein [Bacteroidota bacterium]
MIISPLYNDVVSKKRLWEMLSISISGELKHFVTKSHDSNRLLLCYNHNGIKVTFEESDGKPLKSSFILAVKKNMQLEISKNSFIDKIFQRNTERIPLLNTYKIKSNSSRLKDAIINDPYVLDSLNTNQFYSLYGYTKNGDLNLNITFSFFVNNYTKLKMVYLVNNNLIDIILANND